MQTKMKHFIPVDQSLATQTVQVLDLILLDQLELLTHVKTAHWNLRDANFIVVHRFLDEVAAIVSESADVIAERIRQLGSPVNAPSSRFSSEDRLKPFPTGELSAQDALNGLCESFVASISGVRHGITATTSKTTDEPVTTDILTNIAEGYEKLLWMLDSHRVT
ncbi:MAG: DNA starvation/stationary phase protection protein [Fimbriimonadaceae bacterium]